VGPQSAFSLWLVLSLIVGVIFLWVAASAWPRVEQAAYTRIYHTGGVIRWVWFIGLSVFLLVAFFYTLQFFPYPQTVKAQPREVVEVTAGQFYFNLSQNEIPSGVPVEFRVTSLDVNHAFGVYNQRGELFQTQAMPGYTNRLIVTLPGPGEYEILCLEYCGIGHHRMLGKFQAR
jgi:cytochrome c oxidase subunit 2